MSTKFEEIYDLVYECLLTNIYSRTKCDPSYECVIECTWGGTLWIIVL